MNKYYFDWQESGYYGQTENIMHVDSNKFCNENSFTTSLGRKKGKLGYAFVTLLTITVFAAGALTVLGTECLIYKMI